MNIHLILPSNTLYILQSTSINVSGKYHGENQVKTLGKKVNEVITSIHDINFLKTGRRNVYIYKYYSSNITVLGIIVLIL